MYVYMPCARSQNNARGRLMCAQREATVAADGRRTDGLRVYIRYMSWRRGGEISRSAKFTHDCVACFSFICILFDNCWYRRPCIARSRSFPNRKTNRHYIILHRVIVMWFQVRFPGQDLWIGFAITREPYMYDDCTNIPYSAVATTALLHAGNIITVT